MTDPEFQVAKRVRATQELLQQLEHAGLLIAVERAKVIEGLTAFLLGWDHYELNGRPKGAKA